MSRETNCATVARKDQDDLAVFRWLEEQIHNKKAITACLLVLRGTSCTEAPPGEGRAVET